MSAPTDDRLAAVHALLDAGEPEKPKLSQATKIVDLCGDLNLFRYDDDGYAGITIDGRRETHPLRSKPMRSMLAHRYYKEFRSAPGNQALEDALSVLKGRALFEGEDRPVHTRIAAHGDRVFLDIGDPGWRAIDIDRNGWRVTDRPPVHFIRRRGMQPLPLPVTGGDVDELRQFLNVADDIDYRRLVAWLVQSLRPRGPYPVLVLTGEQGTAKSTTSRLLRSLIDPNVAPIRTMPRDERDLESPIGDP